MFLYIDCLKGLENLVVSVSSRGKRTWTAVLESASSCSTAWAKDTDTIKLPPKTGTRPDPSPAAYRGTWMPTGERGPAPGRLSWPRGISGNPHSRPCWRESGTAGPAALLEQLLHLRSSSLLRSSDTYNQLCDFGEEKYKPE